MSTTWNGMDYNQRLEFARSCGWANRTAARIAKTPWDKLTIAAKVVIERYKEAI
jgi:hypothetical protein